MARPLRLSFQGATYHITVRGNAKRIIFYTDKDRSHFLSLLRKTTEQYRWRVFAYCLMGNHYHLFIETTQANISQSMHFLNAKYAKFFNRTHNKVGHVFQGRYKAKLVDTEAYALELIRYIILNPVRAGKVRRPSQWPWSSYNATIARQLTFIEQSWILNQFSASEFEARQEFMYYIYDGIGKNSLFRTKRLPEIVGTPAYIDDIRSRFQKSKRNLEVSRIDQNQLFIPLDELFTKRVLRDKQERNRRIVQARVDYCYPIKEIAECVGLHYASVSRIVNVDKE